MFFPITLFYLYSALSFRDGFSFVDSLRGSAGIPTYTIDTLAERLILFVLSFTALIALVVLIVGGISYMLSFGNEEKTRRAKTIVLYALVGLVVIGASFLIVLTVAQFFGP